DSLFEVEEVTANTAVFSLKANEDTLKIYPFKFELYIQYLLHKNKITITYVVVNPDTDAVMYYSIGGHPAFNVSEEGETDEFDQISFQLEPPKEYTAIPLSENGLLEMDQRKLEFAKELNVSHETFKKDALIYAIDAQTEIVLKDKRNQVEVRLKPNQ